MAIENKLVKFGYGFNSTDSVKEGMLSFDASAQAIYVGDGTNANLVTSSVKDATYVDNVLTITKIDGTQHVLNFSDVASAKQTMAVFAALETSINGNATAIEGLSKKLDASFGALETAYKAADASIREDFAAADTSLSNRIKEVEDAIGENGSVATQITNAIGALDSSKEAEDASKFVKVKVDIVDGKLSENGVVVSTTDIAKASDLSGHTGNGDIHVTAQQKTDWQNATDAINAFITSDSAQNTALDTLKEIQDFLSADDGTVKALTSKVDANEDAIEILNGDASTAGSVAKAVADAKAAVVGDAAEEYNTLGKLEDKIQAEATSRENADKALGERIDAITNGTNAVISFGGQKGEITVRGEQTANGAVNLSMNGKQLEASIVGLGSAAYTEASAYATAAQGALADSAVQSVVEGETNGTIKVDGTAVAVHGLGSAAFVETTAFDASGAANTAKADVIGKDGDASTANTIYGAKKYAAEVAEAAQNAATVTGVNSASKADAKGYVTIALELNNKNVAVNSVAVDTQAVADATEANDGLATAYDVKQYVDAKDASMDARMDVVEAQLKWVIL